MTGHELYVSLAVAISVGFLIGLQREQHAAQEGRPRNLILGGIRTYPIFAISGAVSVLLSRTIGPWIVIAGFVVLAVPLIISYWDDVRTGRGHGMTTESALVATFLLGALAMSEAGLGTLSDRLLLVSSLGIVVTTLLSTKQPLHNLAAKVSGDDLIATVKFLIATVIVLPLLPNVKMGPGTWTLWNPRGLGLMVTLIASVGFVGYLANRILGPGRGLGVTGVLGGLASSTAVTLSMSARSKRDPGLAESCALATVLASTVMLGRVFILVGVLNAALILPLALPIGAMAGAGILSALVLHLKSSRAKAEAEQIRLNNPFELGSALKFGLLMAAILFLVEAARRHLPLGGIYLASAIAGTTDVDAITISAADMVATGLAVKAGATTIVVAIAANSVVKAVMAVALGGPGFRRGVVLSFLAVLLAGGAGTAALWLV